LNIRLPLPQAGAAMRIVRPLLVGALVVLVAVTWRRSSRCTSCANRSCAPPLRRTVCWWTGCVRIWPGSEPRRRRSSRPTRRYAPELSDLKGVKLSSGTSVVILMSSPKGWKAEATHPSLKGAEVVHRDAHGRRRVVSHDGRGWHEGRDGRKKPNDAAGPPPPAQHQH